MERNDIVTILIAVGLALFAAYIMWPDQVGDTLNSVVDTFVVLTTTEEFRLSQLEPDTQAQVRALIQTLANQGMVVQVGQTLRTSAQEKAAIDSGHSAVKTASWHESGRAVDLYPIDPNTNSPDLDGVRDDLFVQMQQTAVSMGFHQIAYDDAWNRIYHTNAQGKKFWDGGHMEWRGGFQTAQAALDAYNQANA